jgi:O-antigen/teichoic acid export membrane protein
LIEDLKKKYRALVSTKTKTLHSLVSIFVLRGGNILLQLLIIPISIRYVSASSFGLWLTVSSMIGWLNIMDIGLSAGLRNKLTEALTKKDIILAKAYVSTTYAILLVLSLIGFSVCLFLIFVLAWRGILSIPTDLSYSQFQTLLIIVSLSFFVTFLLKPIASVAYATHKPEIEFLILFLSNLVNIVVIWLVTIFLPGGGLIPLAVLFCFTPIVVTFVISIYLFGKNFKAYSPSLKSVDLKYTRALTGLSLKFFVIQISATVVFTTNNFIISHYFGNTDVTKYNIVSKYFNTIIILQSMILIPFWTYFTEAYVKKDFVWLQTIMRRLLRMALLFSVVCVFMALVSGVIYSLWVGTMVNIPISYTLLVALFTCLSIFAAVFSTFLNGTGRIKLQMYTSLIPSILHIPFTIFIIKYFNFGVVGVIGVSSFWLIITLPLRYIQYRKIVSNKQQSPIWVS